MPRAKAGRTISSRLPSSSCLLRRRGKERRVPASSSSKFRGSKLDDANRACGSKLDDANPPICHFARDLVLAELNVGGVDDHLLAIALLDGAQDAHVLGGPKKPWERTNEPPLRTVVRAYLGGGGRGHD